MGLELVAGVRSALAIPEQLRFRENLEPGTRADRGREYFRAGEMTVNVAQLVCLPTRFRSRSSSRTGKVLAVQKDSEKNER